MSIIITESQFEVNQKHYPSFTFKELACQETGEIALPIDFLKELQKLRDAYGKPMIITSGYRSPRHSIEAKKSSPGYHSQGAVDVSVSGEDAIQLLKTALNLGWTGIGINTPSFIHLDRRPIPTIWKY